jgi:nitrile hydratase subunit beta
MTMASPLRRRDVDWTPEFQPGDRVRIATRSPTGYSGMPFYLRGKRGTVESVVEPAGNAGDRAWGDGAPPVYRLAIPLTEIWPDYVGSPNDGLRIDVLEPWLLRI